MHTPAQRTSSLLLAAACLSALALGACSGKGELTEGPNYPVELRNTRTLDIQVTRNETDISLTNTTAAPIGAGRMWVNAWYHRDFPGLAVGESITLNLYDFQDRYGDDFRAGGFWATDRPDKLALAQIETGGELLGLIVVAQGNP